MEEFKMKNAFDFWDQLKEDQKKKVIEVEKKYGTNRWWESNDPYFVVKHQLAERILMVDLDEYHTALNKILEREVYELELLYDTDKLQAEFSQAIIRKSKGIKKSDAQIEVERQDNMMRLDNYIKNRFQDRSIKIDAPTDPDINQNGIDTSGYDGWIKPK
jgi:hypothetical protein